jgi:hypothetical protein
MQTWEYCYVMGNTIYFIRSAGVDEQKVRDGWAAIAALGLDGWELVNTENTMYTFKRPFGRPTPEARPS